MQAGSSEQLLEILKKVGIITMRSLVIRQTGSVERLFNNLIELRKKGFVEVEGDKVAVEQFIKTAMKKESEGLNVDQLKEELYGILEGQPDVADAMLRLTNKGLSRARCY